MPVTQPVTLRDLDALMAQRYSCRAYLPKAVPQDVITAIVSAARKVPSWCNAQPWQLVITRGAETDRFRKALTDAAMGQVKGAAGSDLPFPAGYSGVYKDRRKACGWALYEAVGVEKGDRVGSAQQMMRNFDLFGAPHVAIVTSPVELGPYGGVDCGGFVTAFTLAAQAAGVATIAQAAIAGYSPFIRDYFDVPEDRQIICGISFGYADPDHPANGFRTARADPEDIIDWKG